MPELLQGLNPQQKEAVLQIDGPLLVLAGAGSGKTRVLTHRIAHMLKEGIRPWNILAVTFTNKAASEMRERVRGMIGPDADNVWISTFHSTCLRILRRDIEALGYERSFNIYDTSDQKSLLRSIIREMGYSLQEHPPRLYIGHIDDTKKTQRSLEEHSKYLEREYGKISADIFKKYEQALRSSQALDFNDLINKTVELLQENPGILWRRQQQFQYLMVDEYQDTNHSQYELIKLLSHEHRNLMVVGDDDQSIYGFRGADVQNIYRLQKDYEPVNVIRLEQNYRSFQNILTAANAVISNNRHRMEKKMWTSAPSGPKIGFLKANTSWDEARDVRQKISRMIRMGRKHSDFAIIYRTNAASLAFEQEFMKNAVPHILVGARKFYERKEIKDILSYLRLILNPADNISFVRAVGAPKRGVGDKSLERLAEIARNNNQSMLQAAKAWSAPGKSKLQKSLGNFCDLIAKLRLKAEEKISPDRICQIVIEESGYSAALLKEMEKEQKKSGGQKSDAERRLENIEVLQEDLARCWDEYKKPTSENEDGHLLWLQEFLDRAALTSPTEDIPEPESGAITLLTAHLAKGLEFPVVFVVGLNEGNFPHYRSMEREEDIEEERRLVYVAFTRAKEVLNISCSRSQQRRDSGGLRWVQISPSRFLDEVPEELFDVPVSQNRNYSLRPSAPARRTVIPSANRRPQSQKTFAKPKEKAVIKPNLDDGYVVTVEPSSMEDFSIGVRVSHQKFGKGIIRKKSGAPNNPKLRVEFERHGVKTLIAQYANLEIIIQ